MHNEFVSHAGSAKVILMLASTQKVFSPLKQTEYNIDLQCQ